MANYSGKWVLFWHDQWWGPFDSELVVDRLIRQIELKTHAPQHYQKVALFHPGFVFDVLEEWNASGT